MHLLYSTEMRISAKLETKIVKTWTLQLWLLPCLEAGHNNYRSMHTKPIESDRDSDASPPFLMQITGGVMFANL